MAQFYQNAQDMVYGPYRRDWQIAACRPVPDDRLLEFWAALRDATTGNNPVLFAPWAKLEPETEKPHAGETMVSMNDIYAAMEARRRVKTSKLETLSRAAKFNQLRLRKIPLHQAILKP